MSNGKKAVIISSGGLDSTTCMGIADADGYELFPLTFDYGQRHRIELEHAYQVASYYGVAERHQLVRLPFFREWGGSALTDDKIAVPEHREATEVAAGDESQMIPVTYVPGRNLLFLSIACSYAEVIGAEAIYIGVNALDYSGYPDCRPDFIHSFEQVAQLATKIGVQGAPIQIMTPLIYWTKAQIISYGMKLGVPYQLTTSCYNGQARACGKCDSCRLRLKGFADAGYVDPIDYEQE
jgi:7-cyano-7-deazaguanine synthase